MTSKILNLQEIIKRTNWKMRNVTLIWVLQVTEHV